MTRRDNTGNSAGGGIAVLRLAMRFGILVTVFATMHPGDLAKASWAGIPRSPSHSSIGRARPSWLKFAPSAMSAKKSLWPASVPRAFATSTEDRYKCKGGFSPGGLMARLQPAWRPVWADGDSRRVVYIAADAHSGSSLLAQLLSWNPDFFYLFEPDSSSDTLQDNNNDPMERNSMQYWRKIFACDYANQSQEVLDRIFWSHGHTIDEYLDDYQQNTGKAGSGGASNSTESHGQAIHKLCINKHIAVKVISQHNMYGGRRFGMDRLSPICHAHNEMQRIGVASTMHHVSLFRDPRAIINANIKSGWIDQNETQVRQWSEFLCRSMQERQNLTPKCLGLRRHTVMYEDMVAHPIREMEDLYYFLGLPLPCDVREQFMKATGKNLAASSLPEQGSDSATRRLLEFEFGVDASARAAAWTKELDQKLQNVVEDVCRSLLPAGIRDYYAI